MIYEQGCNIQLDRKNAKYKAYFHMGLQLDKAPNIIWALSDDELKEYNTQKYEKRRKEYVLGRYIAKKGVSYFLNKKKLNEITIAKGIFNQPILYGTEYLKKFQVSLSHVNNIAVSIIFPEEHPMGIDIEKISNSYMDALSQQILDKEKNLIHITNLKKKSGLTLLWTVKESLSKILKTGLTVPLSIFAVKSIQTVEDGYICEFDHFLQYKTFSWIIGSYICTICLPRDSFILMNTKKLNVMYFN